MSKLRTLLISLSAGTVIASLSIAPAHADTNVRYAENFSCLNSNQLVVATSGVTLASFQTISAKDLATNGYASQYYSGYGVRTWVTPFWRVAFLNTATDGWVTGTSQSCTGAPARA
ncbi:hypothetical protein GCM10009785_33440 [Brooklawnia cerclae]|uniref:Secreted protein n=1 Tax=Brooklawnia cerclae TaxID=349934 RepID=A0ABX0SEX5_9ACTN|nr:hypothetical protein [Brooklawnia cerclae]